MAYTNATPSSMQIATTNNYISSTDFLNSMGAITDADRGEMLVERYGSQNLTGLMEMLGNKAPVDSTTFYHYEEGFIHSKVSLDDTTGAILATPVQFTGAGDGDEISVVRKGDILQDASGNVLRLDTVVGTETTVTVTVTAVSGTYADGDFAIVGNAFAEGTDQPAGLTPSVIEYKNQVQIMKEAYEVTGSALTEKIWFEVEDPATGRTGYLWALKGEGDTFRRFNNYCETQMIVGKSAAGAINQTEGLQAFAESGNSANTGAWNGDGSALSRVEDFVDTLDSQRGAKENLLLLGHDLSLYFDKGLTIDDRFANGGISYGAFNGSQEMAVGFGISSIYLGGYTFHKMKYDPFSYPEMLGAIGYKMKGCVIPMDSQRDAQSRASIPSLRIRYKAAEGYSREMEHWMEGGAGLDVKTNGIDQLKLNYRTERGFEGFANNRFIWINGTTT